LTPTVYLSRDDSLNKPTFHMVMRASRAGLTVPDYHTHTQTETHLHIHTLPHHKRHTHTQVCNEISFYFTLVGLTLTSLIFPPCNLLCCARYLPTVFLSLSLLLSSLLCSSPPF